MKVSDYIVEYLIRRGITDVFGYPGGMVTHLMHSFAGYSDRITAHVVYNEQGASFAACGYAQTCGKPGVAYATSGPGATNMITGICNAYFDSIPVLFLTGQVNTTEAKGRLPIRQRGFQETEIVPIVDSVTKYAQYVEEPQKIRLYLDRAFYEMIHGRMGPALLDIPMNVLRGEVEADALEGFAPPAQQADSDNAFIEELRAGLHSASKPCLLLGNGVKTSCDAARVRALVSAMGIPVVTSMIAFDLLADHPLYYGFIGAYGQRTANFIVAKSDLIISVGARLDVRQVGAKRDCFAPDARLFRVDIDPGELEYPVHADERHFSMSAHAALEAMGTICGRMDFSAWRTVCDSIAHKLKGLDVGLPNEIIQGLGKRIPDGTVITTDVGQNQVWVAQSLPVKRRQRVLFSGGHGAMGYSLPAAIGACLAGGRQPVVCFSGDGGFQMNIQELQCIARERLPVKVIIFNNQALGMIRHFQEVYFQGEYFQTKAEGGYTTPSFGRIAEAYGIRSLTVEALEQIVDWRWMTDEQPIVVNFLIQGDTYVNPKLEYGKPNQDQEPLLDRALYQELMALEPVALNTER